MEWNLAEAKQSTAAKATKTMNFFMMSGRVEAVMMVLIMPHCGAPAQIPPKCG